MARDLFDDHLSATRPSDPTLQRFRVNLDDLSVHQCKGPGRVRLDEAMVVGRHKERHALEVQIQEEFVDLIGHVRVQIAGGFIGEKHPRIVCDRPGDDDALLLASGELVGVIVTLVTEPHAAQGLGHSTFYVCPRRSGGVERESDVFVRVPIRKELKILKDDPQGATEIWDFVFLDVRGSILSNLDGPGIRKKVHVQETKDGAFSAPGGPNQVRFLRPVDVKRYLLQHRATLPVRKRKRNRDVFEVDHGHTYTSEAKRFTEPPSPWSQVPLSPPSESDRRQPRLYAGVSAVC